MLLFLACIRSRKNKNRPSIRAAVRGDSLSELCVPRIERLPAQGTVASPGPVAGSDVTIGPLLMLVHLLAAVIDRCQRYSGTTNKNERHRYHNAELDLSARLQRSHPHLAYCGGGTLASPGCQEEKIPCPAPLLAPPITLCDNCQHDNGRPPSGTT